MRLAFVSMHTSPAVQPGEGDAGGMNVVVRAQAEALGRKGHQVDIITRRSSPDDPDQAPMAENVTLRHLDAGPAAELAKSVIDDHIDEFAAGLARLGPYDLLHSHHWMSGVAAVPIAQQRGIPHVQSYHSVAALPGSPLSEGEPPESPGRVAGEAFVARASEAIIVNSAAEAHTVIERCGADPDKVHVVPPGVDHELFRPRPRPSGEQQSGGEWASTALAGNPWARAGNGYVLFAARLQPLKGPDLAIAAIAELAPEIRPHLVIAGASSADFAGYTEELRGLVDRLGLRSHVTFIGSQTRQNMAALMSGAKVVLVPSYSETFGLVALESAATCTPVIAAAAGGLREVVVHGETGQLMDSRRPEDWGNALRRLLTTPGLLDMMSTVARVHARHFEWDYAADRLVSKYEELLSGPRPERRRAQVPAR